ncbi:MAG: sugar ABC transporter ATP-binding protein [Candidatus Dormibacter sp.]
MANVELRGVSKAFDGIRALHDVSFFAQGGRVVALVGENGAGKSTLLNILSGILAADAGQVLIDDAPVQLGSPRAARDAGIAIMHQELSIAPHLSVAENVLLSRLPTRGPLLDWRRLHRDCRVLFQRLGVDLDPGERVAQLSVARQQMVEIARAIALDAQIIAMDEPTASLADEDVAHLFTTIRQLREVGVAVVFVSHRLDEVFEIADSITVLRDGQVVGTLDRAAATPDQVVELMVGRRLDRRFPKQPAESGPVLLEVRDLHTADVLRGVSLTVRKGEVVGLAGLVGAGRTELARAIFGADPLQSGTVLLDGAPVRLAGPRDAIRHGIGFVTEDRKRSGLILNFKLSSNITLPTLERFTTAGRIQPRRETEAYRRWAKELSIQARGPAQKARFLSGGNQQKVVLAKWLELNPRLLILDEPTRGVDVGAKVEIYEIMNRLAAAGTAILMISSDLPEVLGMSDRIVVMHEGRVTGEFSRQEATKERVMEAAIA